MTDTDARATADVSIENVERRRGLAVAVSHGAPAQLDRRIGQQGRLREEERMRAETRTQRTLMTGTATDVREAAVQALLDLAACLLYAWEWRPVPGLRLAVSDGASSAETLVSVEEGWYVVEVEPGEMPERLAEVGRTGAAVEALARVLGASALVAEFADLTVMGGGA